MTPTSPVEPRPSAGDPNSSRVSFWRTRLETFLVFLVFFVHGAWPVPDVNETCYVLKAKHYWNPEWLAQDHFLSSADAHWFFYLACGWPTLFLSLESSAWLLRFLGWLALAVGWTALARAVAPRRGLAVLSAIGFLALVEHAHMAGEWIAGGVEGKVFSYACVLLALANVARGRWNRAWLWLAPATLFHVLCGGWASITVAGAWLLVGRTKSGSESAQRNASLIGMAPGLVVWAICTALAVVPALQLSAGVAPATEKLAHEITIMRRLPHHLDFQKFNPDFKWRHAILWSVWGLSIIVVAATNRSGRPAQQNAGSPIDTRRLMRVQAAVAGAAGLALIGIAISTFLRGADGTPPTLLRFYWFRLSDVFAPLGVALSLAVLLLRRVRFGWFGAALLTSCLAYCAADLANAVVTRATIAAPRAFKSGDPEQFRRYREACDWVKQKTPENAVFILARDADSFKWFAERADVVNWKDFPQDAPSIVEWHNRLLAVGVWDLEENRYRHRVGLSKTSLAPMDAEEFRKVGEKYGAQFLFVRGRFDLPFALLFAQHHEDGYAVYDLLSRPSDEDARRPAP